MADTMGLGLDQAQIADAINRQKLGTQRQKNEMMRLGTSDPNSFAMNNSSQISQAAQPSEFWGAGRQLMSPDIDMSLLKGVGGTTSNIGGQDYYYSPYDMSKTSWGNYDPSQDTDLGKGQYQINRNGQNLGTGYKSLADTLKDYGLQDKVTNNSMKDWETLGQVLNYGSPTGDYTTPHATGGNNLADPITGLNTLFGSRPVISDGKIVGYSQGQGTPDVQQWNDQRQWSEGGGWFTKPKQHFQWDVGGSALAHNYKDQNWWLNNARSTEGDNMFIKSDDVANSPGWTNSDIFQRDAGHTTSGGGFGLGALSGNIMKYFAPIDYYVHGGQSYFDSVDQQGLYGAVFDKLDPFLDSVDPLHNEGQNLLGSVTGQDDQKKNFETIAPAIVSTFVPGGAFINAANSANQGQYGAALASLAASAISNYAPSATGGAAVETATDGATGAAANGMGNTAAGAGGASTGIYGTGTSLGSLAADKAAQGFINGTVTNTLGNGGNVEAAMKAAAFSAASGSAGNYLAQSLQPAYGDIASKALGGAASGGLNSLFSGGNAVQGSLFGGMSGGLHGFLNSTAKSNDSFNKDTDKKNYNLSQNMSKLAQAAFKKAK